MRSVSASSAVPTAAMAKLYASEVAHRAASASVQIHGGYSYVREWEISRFHAAAKILEISEGTNEIQRNSSPERW
ncbi:acyl-CoA dehydrogenase family protein [Streptomyces mirabilis]|uniref:acyl-CoA dehydrogenase family protein n=1 Tax=Streptomyces mirabilis TaxID=68239 RepID=UPI0036B939A3